MAKLICSFSYIPNEQECGLMWTHYTNSHYDVRIDFKIDSSYQGEIYKIQYGKLPTYEVDAIKDNLLTIMTTKHPIFTMNTNTEQFVKDATNCLLK
ncbi:hypothetical protein [Helicobacter sp.]|uniref:hypothetical protein n=1 Tax=Helicobacter sp. TaxID=218 RepID=UPI0025BB2B05|nr:hypothetical protein [Helicobacter sp.]MCI5969301.1 hypothetical protein [Helicobacter sp.]MDY2585555.1 hypothetical protein [Helicobacter sp.]